MHTIALYARVSTAQQEKHGTIESQVAVLDAYAADHDLVIAPEHRYIDDGYSGARLDRPALERLRDAAWRGELDQVLILAPDRLARHYAYQYVVVEELERAGCRVVFINGPFNATPEERLVREVHGLFAEFERAALQERSRRGKLHAARQGHFFTGAGPYGYTYLPARDGQPSRCVVNEAEAVVVRQMFAWLVEEQLSTAAVAKRLTAQGVPTRRGHVPWSPASVYKILNNRAYTGTHHYNRSRNAPEGPREGATGRRPTKDPRRCLRPPREWIAVPWAAIISEEVFALGQRQLQLNRERSPRKTKLRYLLSGLLYCGYCGRRLGGHAGVASGRYECTRCRPTESLEQRCHLRAVNQRDIEPVVWEHVAQLLQRPELILDYLRQQDEGEGPALTAAQRELKRLQRQRAALAREEQRLIDAYQVGAVELDELKERRQRLREAGQQLQHREQVLAVQLAHAQQAAQLTETVTAFCEHLQAQLVEPSFELKQRILRLVVERIVVTDDEIVIQHIIPGDDTGRLYLRLSEAILTTGALGVPLHLRGTGLAHIDERALREMTRGDLGITQRGRGARHGDAPRRVILDLDHGSFTASPPSVDDAGPAAVRSGSSHAPDADGPPLGSSPTAVTRCQRPSGRRARRVPASRLGAARSWLAAASGCSPSRAALASCRRRTSAARSRSAGRLKGVTGGSDGGEPSIVIMIPAALTLPGAPRSGVHQEAGTYCRLPSGSAITHCRTPPWR